MGQGERTQENRTMTLEGVKDGIRGNKKER